MSKNVRVSPEIIKFIKDNYTRYSDKDFVGYIKDYYGIKMSSNAIRHHRRRNGLKKIILKKEKTVADNTKEFTKFLIKGRTEKELYKEFGKDYKEMLHDYSDLNLFSQKNQFNEMVYILLPKIKNEIILKEKDWKFHIGQTDEGVEQPFIVVFLPDFKDKVKIAPLFDVHYGHHAHRREKFLAYVRWIEETPNVYTFIGGDLLENALDDGRGMSYDQDKNPENQMSEIVKILAPISHKILFATTGNHEARTYKKTGIDIMQFIAESLHIPYFSGPVIMSILSMGYKWTFYAFHGFGNAQTKGGKINMANRPKYFTGIVNFYVSGHTHDLIVEPETCIVEDLVNFRLIYMTQWTVVCPAFLSWENTYGYRAGYKPPAKGSVSIELFDNGGYAAYMTH